MSFIKKAFRKAFDIELEEALVYPSVEVICESILKEKEGVEFISKENPVSFKMKEVLYEVEVSRARFGYILICKEVV